MLGIELALMIGKMNKPTNIGGCNIKQHTYYYKCLYDGPNCITGKIETYTGRVAITAPSKDDANNQALDAFISHYKEADNFRNIKGR